MKKILILGAAACDVISHVETLPRGNEEISPLSTEEKLGGSGGTAASFIHGMNLPYQLACVTGTGAYSEKVRTFLREKGMAELMETDEPGGCMMRLIDRQGKQSFFLVPGCEYTFHEETVEDLDNDDLASVFLTDDFLADENSDVLLEWMSWLTCPVYFVSGNRIDEMEPEIMNSLYSLSPMMILDSRTVQALSHKEDVMAGMKQINEWTDNTVVSLLGKDGAAVLHDGETFRTSEDRHMDGADEISNIEFAAALTAALSSHVDIRNSLVFAMEAAERCLHLRHELSDYEFKALKQRLAGMIIHG
jgi:sugar/nucleoside kinase (ribokinase family)